MHRKKNALPLHSQSRVAQMAESVDALVSNTSGATHPGSIPGLGTETERVEKLSPFSFLSPPHRDLHIRKTIPYYIIKKGLVIIQPLTQNTFCLVLSRQSEVSLFNSVLRSIDFSPCGRRKSKLTLTPSGVENQS